jgi:hypothetical protein
LPAAGAIPVAGIRQIRRNFTPTNWFPLTDLPHPFKGKEQIMSKDRDSEGPVFSGQNARQGEIILRTRTQRIIFIAGLVGIVALALLVSLAAH